MKYIDLEMFNQLPRVRFVQVPSGCVINTTHKLNQDGYFRKCIDGKLVMVHRWIWEKNFWKIPDGFEVDHICRNRACCNPEHLQILPTAAHKVKTNVERAKDRIDEARKLWLKTGMTGTALASEFNVTVSNACRWIRKFKKE